MNIWFVRGHHAIFEQMRQPLIFFGVTCPTRPKEKKILLVWRQWTVALLPSQISKVKLSVQGRKLAYPFGARFEESE